jgi:AraC family transcriptional regulator
MVCNRCVMVVKNEFEKLGLKPSKVTLGEVELLETVSESQLSSIDSVLAPLGFERIDDRKARLIESIKKHVIQSVHYADEVNRKFNWSAILADELHYEYNYLSNLFSSVEGITLEQYIIRQKIERVKELLFYDELNLSEIANKLGYSSVAHLSAQFKKVTGLTPSELKKSRNLDKIRKSIDDVR